MSKIKIALLHTQLEKSTAYYNDWVDAFSNNNDIDIDIYICNRMSILDNFRLINKKYKFVVMLPSTSSNGFRLPRLLKYGLLKFSPSKIVLFMGNEYKQTLERINFVRSHKVEYIVSQLPQDTAEWLYNDTNSTVISLPPGLNEKTFKVKKSFNERSIDVGTRFHEAPFFLGSKDRLKTLDFAKIIENDFNTDVEMIVGYELLGDAWVDFLNNCKYTIASEAGSSYLERDDKTRKLVRKYLDINPDATFEDIFNKFHKNYSRKRVSGQCISPRHFEAIGTKTCQILIEGRYNDILTPNVHYIELKKDFSNIEEVIEKLRNEKLRNEIVENAYNYVMQNHTYKHRVEKLLKLI